MTYKGFLRPAIMSPKESRVDAEPTKIWRRVEAWSQEGRQELCLHWPSSSKKTRKYWSIAAQCDLNVSTIRLLARAATLHHGLRIKRSSHRAACPDLTRRMTCIDTLNEVSMFTELTVASSVNQAFNCLFSSIYHLRHAYQFKNEPKARQVRASLIHLAWINSHQNEGTLRERQGQTKTFLQEEQALFDSEPWGAGQSPPATTRRI